MTSLLGLWCCCCVLVITSQLCEQFNWSLITCLFYTEDWHLAMTSLSQVYGAVSESLQSNIIRVFLSASRDVHKEAEMLVKVGVRRLY